MYAQLGVSMCTVHRLLFVRLLFSLFNTRETNSYVRYKYHTIGGAHRTVIVMHERRSCTPKGPRKTSIVQSTNFVYTAALRHTDNGRRSIMINIIRENSPSYALINGLYLNAHETKSSYTRPAAPSARHSPLGYD